MCYLHRFGAKGRNSFECPYTSLDKSRVDPVTVLCTCMIIYHLDGLCVKLRHVLALFLHIYNFALKYRWKIIEGILIMYIIGFK